MMKYGCLLQDTKSYVVIVVLVSGMNTNRYTKGQKDGQNNKQRNRKKDDNQRNGQMERQNNKQ